MKLSKFKKKRIRQLIKARSILEKYPLHIKQSEDYEVKKDMIEWLIASEKGEATDVITYLDSFLTLGGYLFDNSQNYHTDIIRLGMLYGYHYKRELWYL